MGEDGLQLFGGDWTERKLDALEQYLRAYTKVLLKQPFERYYIDAFAGTGYREQRLKPTEEEIFQDLSEEEPGKFLDGSARIALSIEPPFHHFVFVEKRKRNVAELEKLKAQFPQRAASIEIRRDDSNHAIQQLCQSWNRQTWRGVLFLDPFGMQVEWQTIEAVAMTQAIDVWILFPFACTRLMMQEPEKIPKQWRTRLDRMFGEKSWFERFYKENTITDIFGVSSTAISKSASFDHLGNYYKERLASVFPIVAPNPCVLTNTRNSPLFQLFFAAANPGKGGEIALKIAKHILDKI